MAGITAFIQFKGGSSPPTELLREALAASYPLPQTTTLTAESGNLTVAMGGVFPAHFYDGSQLYSRGRTTLLLYGEIYNDLGATSAAEYCFHALFGAERKSLSDLNGPFTLFAWDGAAEELIIVTDRLGRFPVFFAAVAGTTVVTTDPDSLFNAGILSPGLPEKSIVDFLTIGFPLGDSSLFAGIERLTGGKVMTISRSGVNAKSYWLHGFEDASDDLDNLVDTLQACVTRAVRRSANPAITLSGGWDSRATCAIASRMPSPPSTVTYGVPESADAEVAAIVTERLGMRNSLFRPGDEFFGRFAEHARNVMRLSHGHATIDLAFQIHMYERLREEYSSVIDSAGCEFRRGIRARITAAHAKRTEDVATFLTSMYSTGVWNEKLINRDFFHAHASETFDRLAEWLDGQSESFGKQIDAFSTGELWAHHYAHGYPLQTNIISCQMPFSDNEFYDAFSRAANDIRWSHKLHRAVIRRFTPRLERIPISYGSCRVPYGETMLRYVPVFYHQAIARLSSKDSLTWLRAFDNYKPFRPYHRWYAEELSTYVSDMLSDSVAGEYLNMEGVRQLLKAQREGLQDRSHSISILLTLVHLLEYARCYRQEHSEITPAAIA